ncbi:T9SS type A sorting domain-containing protein [Flavobacterium ginsenosidimutans]|uniref:T9SS type A sorting domain-containing protein n=1 Tax=Flavobacterium ginsenosidimutans TaxID=687844 RepID=A0ABZ2Q7Y6_9FLAO
MKKLYTLLLFTFFGLFASYAQTIDETFVQPVAYKAAKITVIKELSDGKILLGGKIDFYKNEKVSNLIRLNADYSLDQTFVFNGDLNSEIKDVKVQSNGNLVVLTTKDNLGFADFFKLYQLDPNGTILKEVSTIFNATSIALQADDKILVTGGAIGYYDFTSCYLNRFNSDFTLDETFNNDLAFNGSTNTVAVSGNDIYVGGSFSDIGGVSKNSLVKLDSSGNIDNTFDVSDNINGRVFSLTLQDDGKLLIGGNFYRILGGEPSYNMCRLNTDGTVDNTFTSTYSNFYVSTVAVKDSDIYLSWYEPAQSTSFLVKLNSDGSANQDFAPVKLNEFGYQSFAMGIVDNKIIYSNSGNVGNKFGLSVSDLNGGPLDSSELKASQYGSFEKGEYFNGKLVVKGDFVKINDVETFGIGLLNENGSVDESFVFPNYLGDIKQFQVIDNETIFVSTKSKLLKLNNQGVILKDFVYKDVTALLGVEKFKVLDNGKILITDQWSLVLLSAEGVQERNYALQSENYYWFTGLTFELQADKIIVGAMYNDFSATPYSYKILRFDMDGSLDETFTLNGSGPDTSVGKIKVLDTGEIILAGVFLNFNGISVPNQIVKLSKDGEMDLQFNENQKESLIGNSSYHDYKKIEVVDSVIYITEGNANVTAINLDGTFVKEFEMPVQMDQISDIVALEDAAPSNTGKFKANEDHYIFAIGSSKNTANGASSFVVKVNVGKSTLSTKPTPDVLKSNVQIYPVPVRNTAYLSFSNTVSPNKVVIYAMNGSEIYSAKIENAESAEINLSNYKSGTYIVKLFSDTGVVTKKIVKN